MNAVPNEENPANPVKGGGAEVSATLMAGVGLIASLVQLAGYASFAGGIYAAVQSYVLWRWWSNRPARTSRCR